MTARWSRSVRPVAQPGRVEALPLPRPSIFSLAPIKNAFGTLGLVWGSVYLLHTMLTRATGGRVRLVPYAFMVQPLGTHAFDGVRDDPRTTVALTPADSPLVRQFPRSPAVVQRRYQAGAQCYAVCVKGQFAGHIWISHERYDEDEVRCQYRLADTERAVWDFDVYVAPEFRGGRAVARLWKGVDAALTRQQVQCSFSRVSRFNPSSLAAHSRLGVRQTGWASFLVIGPMQLCFASVEPHLHLSWHPGSAPTFILERPREWRSERSMQSDGR